MPNASQKILSISDLFEGDIKLASPPNIYFELQKTVEDRTKSIKDSAFIIEKDASLALKLLKIVNSAFYGFPSKIASIDRAINLVGVTELQNLLLSTIVLDKFADSPNDLLSMHDFWAKNLRCALIAQEIDRYLGNKFCDSIFICGILHNIGQLIFFRRIPDLAKQVHLATYEHEDSSSSYEIEIETNLIGFDRYQTGALLTKQWKLPDIISESIKLHAYPDDTGPYYQIAAIVRVADQYSRIDRNFGEISEDRLGISSDDMSQIIELAYSRFEEVFKIFYQA